MNVFNGTPGEWSADIGADDLRDNLVQVMVTTNEDGFCCAYAFGRTYEEAMANAKIIANAPAAIAAMENFCKRVEAGEVKSKRTYAEFKEILENALDEDF